MFFKSSSLFALALSAMLPIAHAACIDGKTVKCTRNGKPGIKTCVNGRFTPCEVDEPPPPPDPTGTLFPRYYILSVIYSPPGTKGGGSTSQVSYGSGSSTGTTTQVSSSFKQGYEVKVTAKGGVLGSVEAGPTLGYERNASNDSAMNIKKSATSTITVRGPSVDGVDHDRDQIWLWLNPRIQLSVGPAAGFWTLPAGQRADLQFVFVGHLKRPAEMPIGVRQRLEAHGITPADYPEILKANPFASGSAIIRADRYQSLLTTFPYEPPFAEGDPATTLSATISNSTSASNSSTIQNEYTVGLRFEAEAGFPGIFKTKIESESKWVWTNKNTHGSSTESSESASVTVGGPAFGYQGPTDMAVYYDVLYKTFLFAPITEPIGLSGTVISKASGKPTRGGREVIVKAGGKTYRTFTNRSGRYRVRGAGITGPVEVRVGGVSKRFPAPGTRTDIELP